MGPKQSLGEPRDLAFCPFHSKISKNSSTKRVVEADVLW